VTALIFVLLITGTIAGYFFGADHALKLGQSIIEYWLLIGLAVMFLTPIIRLLGFVAALLTMVVRFVKSVFKKIPRDRLLPR